MEKSSPLSHQKKFLLELTQTAKSMQPFAESEGYFKASSLLLPSSSQLLTNRTRLRKARPALKRLHRFCAQSTLGTLRHSKKPTLKITNYERPKGYSCKRVCKMSQDKEKSTLSRGPLGNWIWNRKGNQSYANSGIDCVTKIYSLRGDHIDFCSG